MNRRGFLAVASCAMAAPGFALAQKTLRVITVGGALTEIVYRLDGGNGRFGPGELAAVRAEFDWEAARSLAAEGTVLRPGDLLAGPYPGTVDPVPAGSALEIDSVVVVRGRVDHKDANKTAIVVNSVEPFQPTAEDVEKAEAELAKMNIGPQPFPIRIGDVGLLPPTFMQELKELLETFPGDSDVILEMLTSSGTTRHFRFGPSFRVAPNVSLRAELEQILGPALLRPAKDPEPEAAVAAA